MSDADESGCKSRMSSANIIKLVRVDKLRKQMSLLKITNSRGPKIEPWGMPEETCIEVERSSEICTH